MTFNPEDFNGKFSLPADPQTISGHLDFTSEGRALFANIMRSDLSRQSIIMPRGTRWPWYPVVTGRILIDNIGHHAQDETMTANIDFHYVEAPAFSRLGAHAWIRYRIAFIASVWRRFRVIQRAVHERSPAARVLSRMIPVLLVIIVLLQILIWWTK